MVHTGLVVLPGALRSWCHGSLCTMSVQDAHTPRHKDLYVVGAFEQFGGQHHAVRVCCSSQDLGYSLCQPALDPSDRCDMLLSSATLHEVATSANDLRLAGWNISVLTVLHVTHAAALRTCTVAQLKNQHTPANWLLLCSSELHVSLYSSKSHNSVAIQIGLAGAEISPEAAKGADLWSIFDLMGFVPEEAHAVYQDAAEHDTPFSFPVTLKDKTEPFTMLFRSVLPCTC